MALGRRSFLKLLGVGTLGFSLPIPDLVPPNSTKHILLQEYGRSIISEVQSMSIDIDNFYVKMLAEAMAKSLDRR